MGPHERNLEHYMVRLRVCFLSLDYSVITPFHIIQFLQDIVKWNILHHYLPVKLLFEVKPAAPLHPHKFLKTLVSTQMPFGTQPERVAALRQLCKLLRQETLFVKSHPYHMSNIWQKLYRTYGLHRQNSLCPKEMDVSAAPIRYGTFFCFTTCRVHEM